MSTTQRMELYERPFRVIFIDTIGPIHPADGEYLYLAHAECPFSRFCWIQPLKDKSAATWAKFLVEQVFFDVCGFPAVLRSDRGAEFCNEVIKQINELLGVEHVMGSAYHPESQGYIEGRHKPINNTLRTFCLNNKYDWAQKAKLCQ